jgi:hypothetical protein
VRARAFPASVLVAVAILHGCAIPEWKTSERYKSSHLMDTSHPVHGYPAQVGYYTGTIVGGIVLGPFALLEGIISSRDIMHRQDGPFHYANAHLGGGCSWLLGGPFYLLGLPFEEKEDEPAPPEEKRHRPPEGGDFGVPDGR